MTDFIFYDAYQSPGRWHVAEEAEVETIPESRESVSREVIDWRKPVHDAETVEGVEYYRPDRRRDDLVYPILGVVKATLVKPEHVRARAFTACVRDPEYGARQKVKASGTRSIYTGSTKLGHKKNVGKDLGDILVSRPWVMFLSGPATTPEPLCLHCLRRLEA